MKRIATPLRASCRTCANRRSTSCADRAAVGSSMIRTRTSSEIAFAISTACCEATVRPLAGVRGSRRTSSVARIDSASRYISRQWTIGPRCRWPMKMFSATLRSGKIAGSW